MRASYGLDAPGWIAIFAGGAVAALVTSLFVPLPYAIALHWFGGSWAFMACWVPVGSLWLKTHYLAPRVLAAARIGKSALVLDLGTGRGLLAIGAAKRITAVVPYFGYSGQDRKVAPRVPISAKLVADLITASGASRVLTVDLHAGQIQGFFNIPVDNLYAMPVLIQFLRKRVEGRKVVVVSPDAGGVERARAFARRLNADLAIIDKRRKRASEVAEMRLVGEVRDAITILVDDMIDTGGTISEAAKVVIEAGAEEVITCATHPILSDPACERLGRSTIKEIITTNSIPLKAKAQAALPNLRVISVGGLIAEAVRRIHNEESVSSLFN